MSSIRVVVTGKTLAPVALKKLEEINAKVEFMPGVIDEDRLVEEVSKEPTQVIIMRANPPISRRVIEAAKGLKIIAKHGAGIDNLDVEAATENKVLITISSDANASSVAEMAMALMLNVRRQIARLDKNMREGIWEKDSFQAISLSGQTLGIIGMGRIGKIVAEMAKVFGMNVISLKRNSKSPAPAGIEQVSFEELLKRSDVVSLHCPLTDDTKGLINKDAIAQMKDGALLINTARGAVIDEVAVTEALKSGKLAGAGLDTFDGEPIRADNPLWKAPNVIMTPHVAANTTTALDRMGLSAATSVVSVIKGEGVIDKADIINQF